MSLSLIPECPQRLGGVRGQGDTSPTPVWAAAKFPPPGCSVPHGTGTPLWGFVQGTSLGTLPKQSIPCVLGVPPPPAVTPGVPGMEGLCLHPGLCPPALALPQLLEIFPIENPTGHKTSPLGTQGLIPHRHQSCTFQAGSGDIEGTSPGPSEGAQPGGPMRGDSGVPYRGTAGSPAVARPLPGCPGAVSMEAASEQERGRESWELAPSPGSPGAPTAAGGRGPAATAPAKYLPEWHRAMEQPPARPAPRGRARQNTAPGDKARLWVAKLGSGRQSSALGGKARL